MAIRMDYNRGVTKEVIVDSSGDPLTPNVEIGDPVRVGELVGVAMTAPILGDDGKYWATVAFQGVLSSVGTEHIASAAVDQGTPIYTSTTAGAANAAVTATLTTDADDGDSTDYKLFGYVLNTRDGNTGNLEIKVVN